MATQKAISTISYNSEPFLKEHLDNWVGAHIIQAYQYIKHKGEDGDKDHIHLRVEPNKRIDPMDLSERLKEYVKDNDKPLGVRPWRESKEEDWFLYSVHDDSYLKIKYGGGEKHEKLPYEWKDIVVSDGYDLETAWIRAKSKLEHTAPSLVKRLKSGESALNMVEQGENAFIISNLLRIVGKTDYERVQNQLNAVLDVLDKLFYALEDKGLYVYEKDSVLTISEDPLNEELGDPVTFSNRWTVTEEDREFAKENKRKLMVQKRLLEGDWENAENGFEEM